MGLLKVKNEFFSPIISFINDNKFIKACLIISAGALVFLLGTKVGASIKM
ncbi:hypothetical protein [Clostridium sp.]